MTSEQVKIADELLTYINGNGGFSTMDGYPGQLEDRHHSEQDYNVVKKELIWQGLIEETNEQTRLWIKDEGKFAASMGYAAYLIYLHKKRNEKNYMEHSSAVLARWQIRLFWPMTCWTILSIIGGLLYIIWQVMKAK